MQSVIIGNTTAPQVPTHPLPPPPQRSAPFLLCISKQNTFYRPPFCKKELQLRKLSRANTYEFSFLFFNYFFIFFNAPQWAFQSTLNDAFVLLCYYLWKIFHAAVDKNTKYCACGILTPLCCSMSTLKVIQVLSLAMGDLHCHRSLPLSLNRAV